MLTNLQRYDVGEIERHLLPGTVDAQEAASDEMAKQLGILRDTRENQNNAINVCAFNLGQLVGQGLLDRSQVEGAIFEVAEEIGYVRRDGERQTRDTIRSGLEAGIKAAREASTIIEHADPIPLAEHYLEHGRTTRLVRWRDQFYEYTGTHYRRISDEELAASIYQHVHTLWTPDTSKNVPGAIRKVIANRKRAQEIVSALPSIEGVLLPDDMEAPAWLRS